MCPFFSLTGGFGCQSVTFGTSIGLITGIAYDNTANFDTVVFAGPAGPTGTNALVVAVVGIFTQSNIKNIYVSHSISGKASASSAACTQSFTQRTIGSLPTTPNSYSAGFVLPWGVAVDSKHNIFVSDAYCANIVKIVYNRATNRYASMSILAGYINGGSTGPAPISAFVDGIGTYANFVRPMSLALETNF
jgi:hypothetical protein